MHHCTFKGQGISALTLQVPDNSVTCFLALALSRGVFREGAHFSWLRGAAAAAAAASRPPLLLTDLQ